jgi:hypothetical protein
MLLDNSEFRKKVGESARRTALEQFNETKFIDKLHKVFTEVLNQK